MENVCRTCNCGMSEGFYINNPVMGDDLERYVPVEKERQKEAVKYLSEEVFTVPEWLFCCRCLEEEFSRSYFPGSRIFTL